MMIRYAAKHIIIKDPSLLENKIKDIKMVARTYLFLRYKYTVVIKTKLNKGSVSADCKTIK